MIGEVLGSYRVRDKLGAGPSGDVYCAEHTVIGRKAAVKVFSTAPASAQSPPFLDGAQRAANLSHSGLVEVFDFDGERGYIVMEFLDGQTLAARIADRGSLPVAKALEIAQQIAAALAVVHEAGLIHGRLSPSNIILVPDPAVAGGERAKLLDTGVVRSVEPSSLSASAAIFMAPEHLASAASADHRSDLYALGCTLYLMLCGKPPFAAGDSPQTIDRDNWTAPRQLVPTLGRDVEALIAKLLASSPGERPQSASAVSAAIDQTMGGRVRTGMSANHGSGAVPVSVSFNRAPSAADGATASGSRTPLIITAVVACVVALAAVIYLALG
ncbi:MAG: serine/threonine-protein kinase [Myxococcota bacterium]